MCLTAAAYAGQQKERNQRRWLLSDEWPGKNRFDIYVKYLQILTRMWNFSSHLDMSLILYAFGKSFKSKWKLEAVIFVFNTLDMVSVHFDEIILLCQDCSCRSLQALISIIKHSLTSLSWIWLENHLVDCLCSGPQEKPVSAAISGCKFPPSCAARAAVQRLKKVLGLWCDNAPFSSKGLKNPDLCLIRVENHIWVPSGWCINSLKYIFSPFSLQSHISL